MTHPITRRAALAAGGALATAPARAQGQGQRPYPDRPVTLIVPFPPGGASDGTARIMARELAERTGQPWVIDNRPGAGATLGAETVARAAPDGYTLLNATTAILAISPHLLRVPFDPFGSFTPLALFAESNSVMACHPSLGVRSVEALIALAKSRREPLFFGSAGNGTMTQMFGEMFKLRAGIELQHVPYRGSAPALSDLLAGRVQLIFDVVAVPAVADGRLTGLASLGSERNPLLPDLPTLEEAGYADRGGFSWFSLLGPAGMPEAVTRRLIAECESAVRTPAVREAMERLGVATRSITGDAFAAKIRADNALFGDVIRRGNVRID